MSLKDFLVKRISSRMQQPEEVVDAVVMNQFRGLIAAMQKYKSVEMTGFGKFIFLDSKAKKMQAILSEKLAKWEREGFPKDVPQKEIDSIKKDVEFLKNRTNAF